MGTSKYFDQQDPSTTNEQHLVDDTIQELIQLAGLNCYYILRDSLTSLDIIRGEDPTSMFQRSYKMEMYLDNPLGPVSGSDMFSKFGLNINSASNFIVSHKTFERFVPPQFRARPTEGDLIYCPSMNQTFEIKKIDEEMNFYTLGKKNPYFYNLRSETFQFSQEVFNTGIDEVDLVESDNAYLISMPVLASGGDFFKGETIYQGATPNTATASATVDQWFPANNTLHIYYTYGQFTANTPITGVLSNTTKVLQYFDDLNNVSRYDENQNSDIEFEANNIIDKTVTNPFGTPWRG